MVNKVHLNGTYSLRELNGASLRVPVPGKCIKLFQRSRRFHLKDLEEISDPLDPEDGQQAEEKDEEEELGDAIDNSQDIQDA